MFDDNPQIEEKDQIYQGEFQYPVNWQKLQDYRRSTFIGKIRDGLDGPVCQQNGRVISDTPKFRCCQKEQQIERRYKIYGPNCVLYFLYLNRIAIVTAIIGVLLGVALLALNLTNECTLSLKCLSDLASERTYKMSLFNILNNHSITRIQVAIWLGISVILTIFLLYLRLFGLKKIDQINTQNITQSDYSIILRRVPLEAKNQDIRLLISNQVFEEVKQYIVKEDQKIKNKISKRIQKERKIAQSNVKIQDNKKEPKQQQNRGIKSQREFNQGQDPNLADRVRKILEINQIIWLYKMDETIEAFTNELENFKKSIRNQKDYKPGKIELPSQFAGTVIVVFNRIEAKKYLHHITKRSKIDVIINYFLPFLSPRSQFLVLGRKVSLFGANQPSDLMWNNVGYSDCARMRRKLISWFEILVLISISGAASYYLVSTSKSKNDLRINLAMSITITVTNKILEFMLQRAVRAQKLDTKTNLQTQVLYLNVIHQTLNMGFFFVVIPFIMKLPNVEQALESSNFPAVFLQTLSIEILTCLGYSLLTQYFQLGTKIKKWLVEKKIVIKTQSEVNHELKGPSIQFSKKYSDVVKLFWLGFVFGIISPICLILIAIAFILLNFLQRVLFNSKHSIPPYTRIRINEGFLNSLQYIVLHIGVVNFLIHVVILQGLSGQPFDSVIFIVTLTNIVLGGTLVLLPLDKIFQRLGYDSKEQDIENQPYSQHVNNFQITFKAANPSSAKKHQIQIFNQKVIQDSKIDHKSTITKKSFHPKAESKNIDIQADIQEKIATEIQGQVGSHRKLVIEGKNI